MIKYLAATFFCMISSIAFNRQKPTEEKISKPFDLRKIENKSFSYGEKLEYRLHYGPINAGYASLQIGKNPVMIDGSRTKNQKESQRSSTR